MSEREALAFLFLSGLAFGVGLHALLKFDPWGAVSRRLRRAWTLRQARQRARRHRHLVDLTERRP